MPNPRRIRRPFQHVRSYAFDCLIPGGVNRKHGRESREVENLADMIFHGTQDDFSIHGLESLGSENKDAKAGTADVIQLGKIDNQPLGSSVDHSENSILECFRCRSIEFPR